MGCGVPSSLPHKVQLPLPNGVNRLILGGYVREGLESRVMRLLRDEERYRLPVRCESTGSRLHEPFSATFEQFCIHLKRESKQ